MTETTRFGPYVVHECIGAGGMATVHRASIELEDGATIEVALKRLLPQFADDKRFVEDLIREGKLASQLEHPNIVRILELGRIGRTYFIAMDLVRGRSLMAVLQRAAQKGLRCSIGVALMLVQEALDALEHAHAAQIVHRDLTPSNLIVTETGHLKIIDFGVAKALVGTLQTQSGLAKGKLGYMSLEAISGKQVDTRTDVFSAGVVLWELLALRRLFHGDNDIEVMNAVSTGVVDPPSRYNPDVSPALDAVVMRALKSKREERWDSAGDMASALAGLRAFYPARESDVISWVEDLHSDTETEMKPFIYEESDQYELAYAYDDYDDGYDAETRDDLEALLGAGALDSRTYEELGDPTEGPGQAQPKFLEMDTVISTFDRKR